MAGTFTSQPNPCPEPVGETSTPWALTKMTISLLLSEGRGKKEWEKRRKGRDRGKILKENTING